MFWRFFRQIQRSPVAAVLKGFVASLVSFTFARPTVALLRPVIVPEKSGFTIR